MPAPPQTVQGRQNLVVVNIRTGRHGQSAPTHKLNTASHTDLSRKSSRSTLTSGLPASSLPPPPPTEEARPMSILPESMYRLALRSNHGTARAAQPAAAAADSESRPTTDAAAAAAALWLDVHYVSGGVRKQVAFPPGVTAGQARDLCMLRFGVWRDLMGGDGPAPGSDWAAQSSASSTTAQSVASGATSGATASQSYRSSRSSSCSKSSGGGDSSEFRRSSSSSSASDASSPRGRYGLYWPRQAEWLDSQELLSRYPLAAGDRVELQDRGAFIATAAAAGGGRWDEHSGSGAPLNVERQGWVHYMQAKGLSTAWRECWLELHGTALAGYKAAPKTDRAGQPQARGWRDKPLVSVDLAGGFALGDQHSRPSAAAADPAAAALSMLSTMPRVLGVQGSPLVIRCSATREVHIFLARDAADAGSWQGALAQVQHALAGGGSVYTSTIASASMSTIGSASTASLVAGAASPPASTASLAPISRRPRSASPLVHRQPPPPSPLPPIPDAQRFAGTVRVRVGGPRATSGGAPAEALCVVVPGSLVGLPSGYSGPMDAEAAIAAAAEFTVDLAHTRLQVLQRPACGSEDPAAAAAGFVFYILRVAAAEDQQAAVALAFDVDDDAACAQWVDALRTVGGIACVAAPAGASEEAPQALRRSQSCVSGLSQADWPMPPATLPVRSSETVPPEFKRARRQTLAQEPQAGDLLALALPSAAQPADDLADASRRPSLDVAAMRLAADGRGDLPRPLPRVSWLRRAVLRSAAASTADPSPQ